MVGFEPTVRYLPLVRKKAPDSGRNSEPDALGQTVRHPRRATEGQESSQKAATGRSAARNNERAHRRGEHAPTPQNGVQRWRTPGPTTVRVRPLNTGNQPGSSRAASQESNLHVPPGTPDPNHRVREM